MIGLLIVVRELVRGSNAATVPQKTATSSRQRDHCSRQVRGPWSVVNGPRPADGEIK